jgi:hypothetical protein
MNEMMVSSSSCCSHVYRNERRKVNKYMYYTVKAEGRRRLKWPTKIQIIMLCAGPKTVLTAGKFKKLTGLFVN